MRATSMQSHEQRLLLIRHAQGSLGSADYDRLSATGHRQAGRLAERIRATSPIRAARGGLRRHRETAEHFGAHPRWRIDSGLDEYRVDRLLEVAFRHAERLGLDAPPVAASKDPAGHLDVFLRLFPRVLEAWQSARIECETNGRWSAFRARVDAAGVRLTAELERDGAALAVTSAGVISTMVAGLLQRDLAWQRSLNVSLYNASITELVRMPAGTWDVRRINCIEHLEPDLRTLA
jgi:broad specificity phosphatase PhoE